MIDVVEINSLSQLEPFRPDWERLFAHTPGATFFQTFDWLAAYWRHFGAGQKLRVLVVRSAGEAIGILPLVVTPERTRLGTVKTLTYPLHDWGTFYGPIGPDPAATLFLGLKHVAQTPRDWQLLDLRFVDFERLDRGRTLTALENAGFHAWQGVWKETALVDLTGGWNAYWLSRTSKFRNNIRRSQKRLAEFGEVTFERYRPRGAQQGEDDPRWNDFEGMLELARRSWQGASHSGTTISHVEIEPFIRETHGYAARLGMLDVNLLRLNGRLVAFAYNYVHAGHVYGLRMGYDPEFSKVGLGNLMYLMALEDSFARGDLSYDLGTGFLDIKRPWYTHVASSARFTHYPLLAVQAQGLRLKRWWNERQASAGEATSS